MKSLTFICLFIVFSSKSQELNINIQKTINIESNDIYPDLIESNGFYYSFGNKNTGASNYFDLHIIKMDLNFNIIYEKTIGSYGTEANPQVIFKNDTIFVFLNTGAGGVNGDMTMLPFGSLDIWMIALDMDLNIIWQNLAGGDSFDQLVEVISLRNGNLLVLSNSGSGISGNKTVGQNDSFDDPWLFEVNSSNGNIIIQQAITNNLESETDHSICQNSNNGNIYLTMSIRTNSNSIFSSSLLGGADVVLVEYSENLVKIQDRIFGGIADEGLHVSYYQNHLYMQGASNSNISGTKTSNNFGDVDCWFLKLDQNLNIMQDKVFGGINGDVFTNIGFFGDNIIFAGISSSTISGNKTAQYFGLKDIWIIICDLEGNILHQNSYGGSGDDIVDQIIINSNGDLVVLSNSDSPISGNKTEASLDNDIWLLELESTTTLANESIVSNKLQLSPYPNPFESSIQFDLTALNESSTLSIFSIDGRLLFQTKNNANSLVSWEDESIKNQILIYTIETATQKMSGKIMKK